MPRGLETKGAARSDGQHYKQCNTTFQAYRPRSLRQHLDECATTIYVTKEDGDVYDLAMVVVDALVLSGAQGQLCSLNFEVGH